MIDCAVAATTVFQGETMIYRVGYCAGIDGSDAGVYLLDNIRTVTIAFSPAQPTVVLFQV
jgi:hypothetical protein